MDVMYWVFPRRVGRWSVVPGNARRLTNGVASIDVYWENGVPISIETMFSPSELGTRWKGGPVVQDGNAPPTTGAADFLHMSPEAEALVNTYGPVAGAKKFDGDKPMMDLLIDGCPSALLQVGAVLTYGFKKYGGKHGWKALPDAVKRYEAAMLRHQIAAASGEVNDPESGLPHAAHIACNALFLAELKKEIKDAPEL